jgi:hypothetical protein
MLRCSQGGLTRNQADGDVQSWTLNIQNCELFIHYPASCFFFLTAMGNRLIQTPCHSHVLFYISLQLKGNFPIRKKFSLWPFNSTPSILTK